MVRKVIDFLFIVSVVYMIVSVVYPVLKPKKYTIVGRKYEDA